MSRSVPGQSHDIDLKHNIPERWAKLAVTVKQQTGAAPRHDEALVHSQNPLQAARLMLTNAQNIK